MGPVKAAVEMHSTPQRTVDVLRSIPEYTERFKRSFPEKPDPVTFRNMAVAIEVFEATLLTPKARFDHFLNGKIDSLNATEKSGLGLFLSKGCASCHTGVNLGGAGYFHSGKVGDLRQAVAIMGTAQIGAKQPKVEYPILPNRTAATPLSDSRIGALPANSD